MNRAIAKHLAYARVWTGQELLQMIRYAKKHVRVERSRVNKALPRIRALEILEEGVQPEGSYRPPTTTGDRSGKMLFVTNVLREATEGLIVLMPTPRESSTEATVTRG